VPSNTYIATILSIVNAGLQPVLVEPDIRTYNIDPDKIESHITPNTKAIMIVHLYGKPCDMTKIWDVAAKYKLPIIEDCAQSHGAVFADKKAGNLGTFGAFSFYPTKNLGCLGDGGAITTNDEAAAQKLKALRNYGSFKKYYNEYIGLNSRLDELQACFLRVKLKALDDINAHKNRLAAIYYETLDPNKVIVPFRQQQGYEVHHIFPIRHPERDAMKKYLEEKGIKTDIHYPVAPHHQKAYESLFKGKDYPLSEEIHRTELSLPISFCHTEDEIRTVAKAINSF
jgi:dTDP-4-amino-4,6-dideoxygalactose transaminase